MNRCPNCAAQNREGAKFCTSCGFRLPVTSAPTNSHDRSPFATTSTVPPYAEQSAEPPKAPESTEESGFATWNAPPVTETPGKSWDAPPPQNTTVPVNEEMIASLVGDSAKATETEAPVAESVAEMPAASSWAPATAAQARGTDSAVSVDQLLKLVRELEYGLVELADAPAATSVSAPAAPTADSRLLSNALADLQDEDELTPLRTAVASAQERPRDVDVMLDLVLRADAIAAVITERDQLKAAIELATGGGNQTADAEPSDENGAVAQDEVIAESSSDDLVPEPQDATETADGESPSI